MAINRSDLVNSQELFNDEPLTIADILESIRECEELSCSDMAKKLGISRQHYSHISQARLLVLPFSAHVL
jgi:DNA-binding transcriptional regulator YiaG